SIVIPLPIGASYRCRLFLWIPSTVVFIEEQLLPRSRRICIVVDLTVTVLDLEYGLTSLIADIVDPPSRLEGIIHPTNRNLIVRNRPPLLILEEPAQSYDDIVARVSLRWVLLVKQRPNDGARLQSKCGSVVHRYRPLRRFTFRDRLTICFRTLAFAARFLIARISSGDF